jgi:Omp85 superfamily domain
MSSKQNRIVRLRSFFLLFAFFTVQFTQGQEKIDSAISCPQKDLADVLREKLGKPPKVKPSGSSSLLLVPIIGSNPATGLMFGVGGQFAFRMKECKKYSLLSGSVQMTTKNQYLFLLKNTVYSKRERFFHTGDWRFLIFSQPTYGLGTTAPESGILKYQYSLGGLETTMDSLAQPMTFNFARIHQTMGVKIKQGIYLGLGYQFDGYFKIVDEKLRLNQGDTLLTSHYAYSHVYGFNTQKYVSSALNLSFIMDTRDNMIQAYKGYFLSVNWRGDFEFLGSSKTTSMLNVEWRSFHGVSKKNPTHLIGLWVLGNFTPEGGYPYMILPATAYDQRSRSSRGYTQGRFRGNNYVYSEVEYRFPISGCGGLLGGVLFVNGTSADSPVNDLKLFESIKPGYGIGLRVMLDKQSRSNLAVDFGFGEKSSGFYLAVSETF